MSRLLLVLVVAAAVAAIYATTPRGRWLAERWRSRGSGLPGPSASDEDHQFLLRICGGDYDELHRRLEAELRINPHVSEREAYRRAIRRHMKNQGPATH